MDNSSNTYAQYLAASSIKNLLSDHWSLVPVNQKVVLKDYLLNYLANKGLKGDKNVMKMITLILAKICKLSQFDHPELNNLIPEIASLFTVITFV